MKAKLAKLIERRPAKRSSCEHDSPTRCCPRVREERSRTWHWPQSHRTDLLELLSKKSFKRAALLISWLASVVSLEGLGKYSRVSPMLIRGPSVILVWHRTHFDGSSQGLAMNRDRIKQGAIDIEHQHIEEQERVLRSALLARSRHAKSFDCYSNVSPGIPLTVFIPLNGMHHA